MSENYGIIANVFIRTVEDEVSDVIRGEAGVFGLRKAVISDLDLIVIIEAVNDLAAFADIYDCSSPLAVLAIVEKVALDQNVASAAALIPLEGIGFKLDSSAAAVETVVADNCPALRCKKHSSCTVIADFVISMSRGFRFIVTF